METPVITTLDEYQKWAGVTANPDLEHNIDIAVLALGVAGEAGEVADMIKKHLGHGHELDLNKLIKELGDVMWYLAVLSKKYDISFQEIAQANINKLAARYPGGFSVEASKNRKEE